MALQYLSCNVYSQLRSIESQSISINHEAHLAWRDPTAHDTLSLEPRTNLRGLTYCLRPEAHGGTTLSSVIISICKRPPLHVCWRNNKGPNWDHIVGPRSICARVRDTWRSHGAWLSCLEIYCLLVEWRFSHTVNTSMVSAGKFTARSKVN